MSSADTPPFDVCGQSIAELRAALERGETTSEELVRIYLDRIEFFDRVDTDDPDHAAQGLSKDGEIALNSVVHLNPTALEEARESDRRRTSGQLRSPLDGICYTAKESFKARGLPVCAGSPAFKNLIAQEDSFAIERLRAAGAILIGLTTMPPMANGGMQRGLHGRAESPYNADYLTSAFGSGSSNGSGTATTAEFAAFGLGEETWSSGRAPASCNSLCAYTPSRGIISTRGNWPLVPTQDVVVPHTRSIEDLLEVLDVVIADDPETRGDFWRTQPWIPLPTPSELKPQSLTGSIDTSASLEGITIAVPAMYINADPQAGTGKSHRDQSGIGGPMGTQIETFPSVMDCWNQFATELTEAGAKVIVTDFPLITHYEGDRPGAPTISTRGLVSSDYLDFEVGDLSAWAWEDFLDSNGDPEFHSLAHIDPAMIFPHPPGALPDRYDGFDDDIATYPDRASTIGTALFDEFIADRDRAQLLESGLRGLEETRKQDWDRWIAELGVDAVIFPTLAGVGRADSDINPASAEIAWKNGVWVANGNVAIRHCGIPTVTVPMGVMADTHIPIGATIAGSAWEDMKLLALAAAIEHSASGSTRRVAPRRTSRIATIDHSSGGSL